MTSRKQDHVKHKELGIQREASKETSGLIYWFIYHQQGNFYQYSQIIIANFNENSPSSECQLNSMIQESSRGTKKRGS